MSNCLFARDWLGNLRLRMIEIVDGDLLEAKVEALVNAVNVMGVMGVGIALQFREKYPGMFKAYARACKSGEVVIGKMHVFDLGDSGGDPRWIINFPTKQHWREPSQLSYVTEGLTDLIYQVRRLKIRSIAIPPLGCGLGGLQWTEVRPLIEEAFAELPDVRVLLFEPLQATAKK
jgi:O-acetyl-ADP-ribose deacetylase (regulator of RNase III)